MYTQAYSDSVHSYDAQVTQTSKSDRIDNIKIIAIAILLVGAAAVIFSPIVHPVLLFPGALIAVSGGGIFLFSFEAPRTFVTELPTYFADYRPSRGYSSYATTVSYHTPSRPYTAAAYARRDQANSSAYVSNGGRGGIGVFKTR